MEPSTHHDSPRPIAEIEHGPGKFEQWLDDHQKTLFVVAVLAVIAVAAWIVIRGMNQGAEHAAGAALVSVTGLAGYQEVTEKHSGTPAAGSALMLAATAQWQDGQQEASIDTLRSYLSDYPEHADRATANASLATRLLRLDRTDEAASAFQSVAKCPVSAMSTLSPAASVLTMAASQAPVPDEG